MADDEHDPSGRLWRAFRAFHRGEDCDHAQIHPWDRLHADEARRPPGLRGPAFEAVLWANFWSARGRLRFYERKALALEAHTVSWSRGGDLFVRVSDSLRPLGDREGRKPIEAIRLGVSRAFHAARRA